jgi:hypothetical protein
VGEEIEVGLSELDSAIGTVAGPKIWQARLALPANLPRKLHISESDAAGLVRWVADATAMGSRWRLNVAPDIQGAVLGPRQRQHMLEQVDHAVMRSSRPEGSRSRRALRHDRRYTRRVTRYFCMLRHGLVWRDAR